MKNIFLTLLLITSTAFGAGKIQDRDVKSLTELQAAGAGAAQLINDTKVYVSANGINKQLSAAVTDGDLGAGGSGAAGMNLITNSDFERSVSTGYITSGTTVSQTLYNVQTPYNKYYARITATASGGYYETVPLYVPTVLANGDLQTQSYVFPVSGTWSIQTISGTTIIASQTLTVSSDFYKSPIIFNPAGPVSTPMKVRWQAVASGSVLGIDNAYKGETTNLKNGAINEAEYPCQVVPQGFTATNIDVKCHRDGDSLIGRGFFRAGGPAATVAYVILPNGLEISQNISTVIASHFVGHWVRAVDNSSVAMASTAIGPRLMFTRSDAPTFIYFSSTTNAGGGGTPTGFFNTALANALTATNDQIAFDFRVPIKGWSGSGTTFDTVCPNDTSCQNVFTAKVSLTGVVTDDTLDFINGNCTNANPSVCTFNPGIFTVAPTPTGTVSSTSTTVTYPNTAGFTVHVQKAGADFKAKIAVQGFMSKNITGTGNGIARSTWLSFGNAGSLLAPASCTTSPCVIYGTEGVVTTVTRAGAALYDLPVPAGSFSIIHTIQANVLAAASLTNACYGYLSSATNIRISCSNTSNNAAQDVAVSVTINGFR